MNKNIFLLSAMLVMGVATASADDKGALYVTPPTAGADTVAYNISIKPVLKHVGNEFVVYINGNEKRHITIENGLKMTFGNTILMGDANRDKVVNSADATAVTEYFIGKKSSIDKNAADMNYDGNVTVADANNITNTLK